MARALLILALVATVFWVYTIVDCALQPASRHRGVSKPVWILITVLLPVLGGILWFVVGRTRTRTTAARRAPDDDPEFLGRIGSISDQDERIRRLEEELAQLDSEGPADAVPGGPSADDARLGRATDGTAATDPPTLEPKRPDGDDDTRGQRGAVG